MIFSRLKLLGRHQRNLVLYAASHSLTTGLSIFLLAIYSRVLTPSEFGIASLAMLISNLLRLVILPGLEVTYARYAFQTLADGTVVKTDIFGMAIRVHLLLSAVVMPIVAWPVVEISAHYASSVPPQLILLSMLSVSLRSLYGPMNAKLGLQHEARKIASQQFVAFLLGSAVSVILVYSGWGAQSLLWGELVSSVILSLFSLHLLIDGFRAPFVLSTIRSLIAPMLALGPDLLYLAALTSLDRIFINYYYGASETGIFFAASQISSIILGIIILFGKQWKFFIVQFVNSVAGSSALQDLYEGSLKLFLAVSACVAVLSVPICELLLSERFASAAQLIPILTLRAFFRIPQQFVAHYCIASRNNRALFKLSMASLFFFLVFSFFLVPNFGPKGAAWATVLSLIFYIFAIYKLNLNSLKLRIKILGPVQVIQLAAIAGAILLVPGRLMGLIIGAFLLALLALEASSYWKMLFRLEGKRLSPG